jgi:hypothetical protein
MESLEDLGGQNIDGSSRSRRRSLGDPVDAEKELS